MAPRLSGQTSIFGVVFFVSKSLLGIERQKKLEKFAIFTRKPRSYVRILIYRPWPIDKLLLIIIINIIIAEQSDKIDNFHTKTRMSRSHAVTLCRQKARQILKAANCGRSPQILRDRKS